MLRRMTRGERDARNARVWAKHERGELVTMDEFLRRRATPEPASRKSCEPDVATEVRADGTGAGLVAARPEEMTACQECGNPAGSDRHRFICGERAHCGQFGRGCGVRQEGGTCACTCSTCAKPLRPSK